MKINYDNCELCNAKISPHSYEVGRAMKWFKKSFCCIQHWETWRNREEIHKIRENLDELS